MNFAKKLREVVASNFIEIAKTDGDTPPPTSKATPEIDSAGAPQYMDAPPPTPTTVYAAPATSPVPNAVVQEQEHLEVAPRVEPEPIAEVVEVTPKVEIPRSLKVEVAPNEPVNLEAIIREANLPQVPFAAEQAAKVLSALPADLPLQVKRLTVKATMEAVERGRAIQPQEIVADAMLKKGHLINYREEFAAKVDALHRETDREITEINAQIERETARLKTEIDRLKFLKSAATRKQRALEQAAEDRVAQMEQVIVFFQSEVARELDQQALDKQQEDDEEELPAFMRDDAVFRMLGMEKEGGTDGATESVSPDASSGKRSTAPRGRFAVAENIDSQK